VRELEFLPTDYLRARFQRQVRFIRSWLLLAMGMAMILWSLQVGAWVRGAQAELLALHGADSAVEADVVKVTRLRAEAEAYNRRMDVLQAIKPRITPTSVLIALADRLPDGVMLEDMNMDYPENVQPDRATLRMRGVAASESAVTETLAALETSAPFGQAVLVESRPRGAGDTVRRSFIIEVSVGCPGSARMKTGK
jgi:Tfp pilus assembly protein PilN